jgi:hypothetical protein
LGLKKKTFAPNGGVGNALPKPKAKKVSRILLGERIALGG